jgi:hypothetical protein
MPIEIEPATYLIIRTNGTKELVREKPTLATLHSALGCELTDRVILSHDPESGYPRVVMIVDDHGYETETIETPNKIELRPIRPLKPVNGEATKLYHAVCQAGTTHEIVGDVALVNDSDFARQWPSVADLKQMIEAKKRATRCAGCIVLLTDLELQFTQWAELGRQIIVCADLIDHHPGHVGPSRADDANDTAQC